jgi:glycosyltransferase involved in cell wall biosynthesis
MRAKRLAILGSRGIPAKYGGFETFAQEISHRLVSAGIDVTVFCEDDGPDRFRGVKLRHVPAVRMGPLSTILFDMRCLWRARKAYDVVYMLGYGTAFFCFLPRLWRNGVWINMDGVEWRRSKWSNIARIWLKAMEWAATRTASRLIVDARAIGDHLRDRYKSLPDMTMIPYGVEEIVPESESTVLDEFDLEPSSYCLVVCRLEPENHILEIIHGYCGLDTEIPLVIVGDLQPDNSYCNELARNASPRIRFVGSVYEPERIWALRRHCRIYFHGHSVGGTNPSLLEAMAAGNLVIAHENPFNREVLGIDGQYFDSAEQIAPLAHEFLNLAEERRNELTRKIRARVQDCYSWNNVRDAYLKLLMDTDAN